MTRPLATAALFSVAVLGAENLLFAAPPAAPSVVNEDSASWGYSSGGSNASVYQGRSPAVTRLLVNRGGLWSVSEYKSDSGRFEPVFVSKWDYVLRAVLADVEPQPGEEIVVATTDGKVLVHDADTFELRSTLDLATSSQVLGFAVADCTGDGKNDFVLTTTSELRVHSANGDLEWSVQDLGGRNTVVGQMDSDPAIEVAFVSYEPVTISTNWIHVVDCLDQSEQWRFESDQLALDQTDLTGDGIVEMTTFGPTGVRVLDVRTQSEVWSYRPPDQLGTAHSALFEDWDSDGVVELVTGHHQIVQSVDTVTGTQNLQVAVNSEHENIDSLMFDDADGDGSRELIWAPRPFGGYLVGTSWPDGAEKWRTTAHTDLRSLGLGNLDGDGGKDVVALPSSFHPRLGLYFDSNDMRPKLFQNPYPFAEPPFQLFDLDGDGVDEIITVDDYPAGRIEAWSLDGQSLNKIWESSAFAEVYSYSSLAIGDIDADGLPDFVVGGSGCCSASQDYVFAIDFATGEAKWSTYLGPYVGADSVHIVDSDGDGAAEVLARNYWGNVYVLNGSDGRQEAQIDGQFLSLALEGAAGLPTPINCGPPKIFLGGTDGFLSVYVYQEDSYRLEHRQTLVQANIDGITVADKNLLWISGYIDGTEAPDSQYRLQIFELREGQYVPIWRAEDQDFFFGQTVVFPLTPSADFVAGGWYSIQGFKPQDRDYRRALKDFRLRNSGSVSGPKNVTLHNRVIKDDAVFEALATITANRVEIQAPVNVSLIAGDSVSLGNDFSVMDGASLRIAIGPSVCN